MGRYLAYYKRVLHHKYLYFKYGKKFGVSFIERLTHNFGMLVPGFAVKMAKVIYDEEGNNFRYVTVDQNSEYQRLVDNYKKSHPYYVEYWIEHQLTIIPEKYLRQFITDRYVDCEMNLDAFLVSNRDLFFVSDSSTEPTYSNQVNKMLTEFILNKE